MEQSKLISCVIAKLKIAYPHYFNKLSKEDFVGMVTMYQEYLGNLNPNALMMTLKKIIKKEEYMPSIPTILNTYRKEACSYFVELINNTDADVEDKKYLESMAEWYSLQEDYPSDFLKRINELEQIKLKSNKKEALPYDN